MRSPILEVDGLTRKFGGFTAVNHVTTTFEDEICAIIGPNGAGKTTFFNLLTGVLEPTSGRIVFQGEDITAMSPEDIARQGLMRSFQITQLFEDLTTLENVRVAVQSTTGSYNFWRSIDDYPELTNRAEELLTRVGMEGKRDQLAANLSHGEQRTLEIAVALGTDPDLLLLDEPSSGMSPEETNDVIELLGALGRDIPIVLVEHKMGVVREVADRIVVLHRGEIIADGPPDVVRQDEQVRTVYLGQQEL